MTRVLGWIALGGLVACGAEPATDRTAALDWTDPQAQVPSPRTLSLSVGPVAAGTPTDVVITGANPGQTVFVVFSTTGLGLGPCPPALGGSCVDLLGPVSQAANAVADPTGTATVPFTAPAGAGGRTFHLQAVQFATPAQVSNTVSLYVYPGTLPGPADDADADGFTLADGDCQDDDPTINPGATDTVGDGIDQDCDGTDGADLDLDGVAGTASGGTDCDDADDQVRPGFPETCDGVDEDCDGVIDDPFPDDDGSGVADCREVAVVVTEGFLVHDLSFWTCDGELPVAREIGEVESLLNSAGLEMVRFDEDPAAPLDAATLSPYSAIVVHNGGWADPLLDSTIDALLGTTDRPLVVVGDDLGFMAENNAVGGRPEVYDLLHLDAFLDNGNQAFFGLGGVVAPGAAGHPVMDGAFGPVGDFAYVADMDHVTLSGTGEVPLVLKEQVGTPVVWAAEEADRRLVVMQPTVYNNNQCPTSDPAGLDTLGTLFLNAVDWVREP